MICIRFWEFLFSNSRSNSKAQFVVNRALLCFDG